ncbi:MAG: triphosphoribosyl-dephospho-CoA synthase [Candidatus Odinarchaeia archaeon]
MHRFANFTKTRFEHFIVGHVSTGIYFIELAKKAWNIRNLSELKLGKTLFNCVKTSTTWQSGGNINFGALILLLPLISGFTISKKLKIKKEEAIRSKIHEIVKATTIEDSIYFYKSVKLAKPGGLKKADKYDVTNPKFIEEIKSDKKNLYDLLEISSKWDSISKEWINKYYITFEIGAPTFIKTLNDTNDVNIATVNTFLKILSYTPDTLIARKNDYETAKKITDEAKKIIAKGGLLTKEGKELVKQLDNELQRKKGLLNPGSSADITISSIMTALCMQEKFPII